MLSAHLSAERGNTAGIRRDVDRAEMSVIEVLESMHALRVAIGDVEDEE